MPENDIARFSKNGIPLYENESKRIFITFYIMILVFFVIFFSGKITLLLHNNIYTGEQ